MPQAAPIMALSLIGVSITRSQPKRSSKPSLVLNAPPYTPTSSPIKMTAGSRSISSNMACLMASRKVTCVPSDALPFGPAPFRSEEHTSELQSHHDLVCRLLLEKKKKKKTKHIQQKKHEQVTT